MQQAADALAVEQAPQPTHLVRRLKERVLAEDSSVLAFDGVLNFAACRGCGIPDSLQVLRNEQKVAGIDLALLDEPAGFFRAPTRVGLIDQAALIVHEIVEVAA